MTDYVIPKEARPKPGDERLWLEKLASQVLGPYPKVQTTIHANWGSVVDGCFVPDDGTNDVVVVLVQCTSPAANDPAEYGMQDRIGVRRRDPKRPQAEVDAIRRAMTAIAETFYVRLRPECRTDGDSLAERLAGLPRLPYLTVH